jgi:chromate transport protein ChrA
MINFFIVNIIVMILVNQIKINSQKKVKTFLIINFFVLFIVANSFVQFLELLIVLFCGLYLFANCYAIRYSSLRIKILNDIIKRKKITSEEQLYNDRIKRFKKNNKTLMDKRAFTLFNSVNNIFRKFFI